ncbi:hypothetical protein J4457_07480 [Candidatus Woesearchaeota archaeon]|nr:hypothetical protein [Candidatus Woesearchaeota archaeon]
MVIVANSPQWFLGVDSALEILFFLISIAIALFSFKIYCYTSKKRYLFFNLAFVLMAFSFLARSLTNYLVYGAIQKDISVAAKLAAVSNVYDVGFLIHILLMLTAYMILIALSLNIRDVRTLALLFLLVVLATVISTNIYTIYYIVSAILLSFILTHFYYNAVTKSSLSAWGVFSAFAVLLLSQGIFLFVQLNRYMYLLGHAFQALAYLILLVVFVMVLRR